MEKICRNCKHWEDAPGIEGLKTAWREEEFKTGWCSREPFDYYVMESNQMAVSCNGYDAEIWTGENFGCIHFEPKPTETKWKYPPGA